MQFYAIFEAKTNKLISIHDRKEQAIAQVEKCKLAKLLEDNGITKQIFEEKMKAINDFIIKRKEMVDIKDDEFDKYVDER